MKKSDKNYYSSISNTPISVLYKVLSSENKNHLLKDWDGEIIDDATSKILDTAWVEIRSDYSEGMSSGGSKNFMKIAEMAEIEFEIQIVSSMLYMHQMRPNKELAEQLLVWKYYPEDADKTIKKVNALKFRLSILKSKSKDLINPEEPKDGDDKVEYNLYKDVVILEESLGGNRVIDPDTTMVAKWVELIKLSKLKNKKK